jgi:hypothetical protein
MLKKSSPTTVNLGRDNAFSDIDGSSQSKKEKELKFYYQQSPHPSLRPSLRHITSDFRPFIAHIPSDSFAPIGMAAKFSKFTDARRLEGQRIERYWVTSGEKK